MYESEMEEGGRERESWGRGHKQIVIHRLFGDSRHTHVTVR